MRLVILGSGTCVPSLERNAPGYLLEAGGKKMLVDCGSGTLLQLEKVGESYQSIDAVFITHTHPDHVADLMPLLQALRATPGYERKEHLSVIGPPPVHVFVDQCAPLLMRSTGPFALELIEMPARLELGPLTVSSCPTQHTDASLAYRFEEGNASLVITGDADYDRRLVELSRGARLLVADCSFPDELKTPGHMTPSECGRLAQAAGVERLVLSHLYPSSQPDRKRLEQCQAVFAGTVMVAEDLMKLEV
jgi:ribonuclease BN (tRNA processing enzyme)